jgi:hypothetical protein
VGRDEELGQLSAILDRFKEPAKKFGNEKWLKISY